MKKWILTALCFPFFAHADLALDLLKESDKARGSVEKGITWTSEVETREGDDVNTREFRVRAKGVDAHVEALQPARNKGEIYLFNDRNMWFFKPSLKKPVAISARQKLSGQAANGDIASTHYSRDYTPTLEGTEVVDGDKTHVLLLKAKANNLTYDQIRYWISDKTKRAVKAEFLTPQGQVFKRASMKYENRLPVDGRDILFVSEVEISDAKMEKNKSIIRYKEPKMQEHPASLFNINNLKR
ncbi:MAG: outer membrane lipoprotein-sorting protein [Bdellovibrionaceae bacterium]|nr:outer membrane lipoprotein-sorting protein [Pseudobdellovibrionaceae bacterium]MBX3034385.1 outer membrane lipoprotein-sorting protein [Pseudobdellovibrionaceae bacterium]